MRISNRRDAMSAEIPIRKSSLRSSRLCGVFGPVLLALASSLALPFSVHACAACYGQSDSPLASGVTWGILSLFAVVMSVLGSIVTFFVYLNKKSAALAASKTPITTYPSPITDHPASVTNH